MYKYIIFIFLFFLITVGGILLVLKFKNERTKTAEVRTPKYLCDSEVTNCSKTTSPAVPKGVCIPGGKCT